MKILKAKLAVYMIIAADDDDDENGTKIRDVGWKEERKSLNT